MRTWQMSDEDGVLRLKPGEAKKPRPGADQVSIDIEIAALGMIDALWASGVLPSDSGFIPGLEVSGTIREIGRNVDNIAVGDRVAALLIDAGGLAEVALAKVSLTARIPDGLGADVAAAVPANTMTAHLAMTQVARFSPGELLLVHAGMGGLGSQFGDVARTMGAAMVDAVVGSETKREAALARGYDHVFLRGEVPSIPDNSYDIVIDPVGGDATEHGLRILRGGGRLIKVGNASQSTDVKLSSLAHWFENKSTIGFNVGFWARAFPQQNAQSLRWSLEAAADGRVGVEVTRKGNWDDVPELLASLQRGQTTGKLVVRV